jgi:hypothetical protein
MTMIIMMTMFATSLFQTEEGTVDDMGVVSLFGLFLVEV